MLKSLIPRAYSVRNSFFIVLKTIVSIFLFARVFGHFQILSFAKFVNYFGGRLFKFTTVCRPFLIYKRT